MSNIEGFIEQVPLFKGLSKRQIRRLNSKFVTRHYESGQEIVSQDSLGVGMYILVAGHAEAIRHRLDGAHVKLNDFKPGDFFGELALLAEGPRTATVIAVEPTDCLILMRSDFLDLLHGDAQMAVIVAVELANRFRRALDAL